MLEARRQELTQRVRDKIHDVRTEGVTDRDPAFAEGCGQTDIQDLDLTLIHIQSDALKKIETALRRIEQGRYGTCSECGGQIAEKRLHALPFALRCTSCEDLQEKRSHSLRRENAPRWEDLVKGD